MSKKAMAIIAPVVLICLAYIYFRINREPVYWIRLELENYVLAGDTTLGKPNTHYWFNSLNSDMFFMKIDSTMIFMDLEIYELEVGESIKHYENLYFYQLVQDKIVLLDQDINNLCFSKVEVWLDNTILVNAPFRLNGKKLRIEYKYRLSK